MGNGLSGAAVFSNVKGLNHIFRPDIFNRADDGTRAIIRVIRRRMYPRFLSYNPANPDKVRRQGSLWFAASVLTPHLKLDARHPARTHRRWIKWLLWLGKAHPRDHNRIIDAINWAIDADAADKPGVFFIWHEDKDPAKFSVDCDSVVDNIRQVILTSVTGDVPEIDKRVAEDEEEVGEEEEDPPAADAPAR